MRHRLAVLALAVTLVGCIPTGERPSLGETVSTTGTTSGVPEVDALLDRIEASTGETFTARYELQRRLGDVVREATVAQLPPRLAVTVGNFLFLSDPRAVTCNLVTATCDDEIQEDRVSDLGISIQFWGAAASNALRVSVGRQVGPPTIEQRQLAGLTVDCVLVDQGAGFETWCVAPNGVVALWDTAALHFELISLVDEVAPDAFARPDGQ